MDDERAGGRPALHRKNARDRLGVKGVRAETVDCLGGEGDQSTGAEDYCGVINLRLGNVLGMEILNDG
jgi:hypothetical protein